MTEPTDTIKEYSVSEISRLLKKTVEGSFSRVRVRAEISGLKRADSGHVYFSLKDENAVLDGVMWRGVASRLKFQPEDGLEVICTGKLTTYPARSRYQMVVDRMEPAGVGALMALLEERKKKLAAEGLFDPARKKTLPQIPKLIGVITSPTGAVIRDILHRLEDRFPRPVIIWPVRVQGEGAAEEIVAAIAGFNTQVSPRPDILIVARGGGSLEDLWAFNEENVVRAVVASKIPLISAVGHETDTTLIDYVSDLRAPTPSAAAELAVPVRSELMNVLDDFGLRQARAVTRYIKNMDERISGLARVLPSPRDLMGIASQKLDELSGRLPRGLAALIQIGRACLERLEAGFLPSVIRQMAALKSKSLEGVSHNLRRAMRQRSVFFKTSLSGVGRLLESLGYQNVLKRGFSVVYGATGHPVSKAAMIKSGDALEIEFSDGRVPATAGREKGLAKARKKKQISSGQIQGKLF